VIVNQQVKLKGTNDYGYILVPIEVDIIWKDTQRRGTAILNELEFVGNKLSYFVMEEK
jgi:hypothetical protein